MPLAPSSASAKTAADGRQGCNVQVPPPSPFARYRAASAWLYQFDQSVSSDSGCTPTLTETRSVSSGVVKRNSRDRLDDARGERHRVAAFRQLREQRELVAAEPRRQIARMRDARDFFGDRAQHFDRRPDGHIRR